LSDKPGLADTTSGFPGGPVGQDANPDRVCQDRHPEPHHSGRFRKFHEDNRLRRFDRISLPENTKVVSAVAAPGDNQVSRFRHGQKKPGSGLAQRASNLNGKANRPREVPRTTGSEVSNRYPRGSGGEASHLSL